MLEQPRPDAGTAGNVAGAFRFCSEVEELLGEAARAYEALPRDAARTAGLRDVYLCGDLYLRVDEWGNDDLQRKLAGHGLRVIFEPYGAFFELLQLRQIQDGVSLKKRPEKEATLATMRYVIGRLDEGRARRAPVGVLERRARRGPREPPAGRAVSLRRDDPGGRRRAAHLAHAAHRRRRVGGAARVRAGPDRRSAAAARGRPPGCCSSTPTATRSTRPGWRASPGGSAAGPPGAPPG